MWMTLLATKMEDWRLSMQLIYMVTLKVSQPICMITLHIGLHDRIAYKININVGKTKNYIEPF